MLFMDVLYYLERDQLTSLNDFDQAGGTFTATGMNFHPYNGVYHGPSSEATWIINTHLEPQ